jgi:hypothetical protein
MRLTKKFAGKIILPMIPMEIKSKNDLENFHKIRKEYENITFKLAEYEDRDENNNCEYCCGDVQNRKDFVDDCYINENNYLCNDHNNTKIKINFCPKCGKDLRK